MEAEKVPLQIEELAVQLIEAREEKQKKKEVYDLASHAERDLQNKLIELMEEKNILSFRHLTLGTFTSAQRIWVRVINQEAAMDFFLKLGLEDEMFQLKPITGRLNEFVKDHLEQGETIPDCLDISPTQYISVRKR